MTAMIVQMTAAEVIVVAEMIFLAMALIAAAVEGILILAEMIQITEAMAAAMKRMMARVMKAAGMRWRILMQVLPEQK